MRFTPLLAGWLLAIGVSAGVRLWNALQGPLMWGYDAWGHVAYVLFLDLYQAVPWADQGWSYFHPPFHYLLGWLLTLPGDAEVLVRGLSVWGSSMSLGTAAVAAWLLRRTHPERPGLALLGFSVLALLPAHLFMSPMPGNEMTLTLLTAASIGVFAANETRPQPSRAIDLITALLLGLALLTKFSGLLPLLVIVSSLGLRGIHARVARGDAALLRRDLQRAAVISVLALAISAPYYARNLSGFGTPFQLSRDFPLVAEVERDQAPGSRSWRDYVSLSTSTFSNPDPRSPALLHSVWSSVYLNVWADVYRQTDVVASPEQKRVEQAMFRRMALLGLLPTALFLIGAGFAVADVLADRRRGVYLPLLLLTAASVAAFIFFSWRVPQWSALKSSYLMALSLPFAVFVPRAVEALESRIPALPRRLLPALLSIVAGCGALAALEGLAFPRRADAPATGAVHFYFEEYSKARPLYARLISGAGYKVPWLENLAALEIAEGHPARARAHYERAVDIAKRHGREDAHRAGRLAVAQALAHDVRGGLATLDSTIQDRPLPELIANRGVLHAYLGQTESALLDLRRSVSLDPHLVAAWRNLALLETDPARAAQAATAARDAACSPPRGYPHGLGTGEILEWGIGRRWLLRLDAELSDPDHDLGLRVLLPRDHRDACAELNRSLR